MPFWLLIALSFLGLLLLADLAVHLFYAWASLERFEHRPPFQVQPPPEDALPPEPIRIRSTNDLELTGGVYYPPDGRPRGIIVFCPETDGSFETALNYTAALVDSGFAVVTFSFRNQKPSEYLPTYHATHWLTEYELQDLRAVLRFVRTQPQFAGLPIGLFGVSRGAGAALAVGATDPGVQAVWAQGAYSTHPLVLHYSLKWIAYEVGRMAKYVPAWHVSVTVWFMLRMGQSRNGARFVRLENLLPKWSGRHACFVSGARDTYVPSDMSRRLCRLSGRSTELSHWVVPHAKHNQERLAAPREFDKRVVQFFQKMITRKEEPVHAHESLVT